VEKVMIISRRIVAAAVVCLFVFFGTTFLFAAEPVSAPQMSFNSGTVQGTVTDSSGAVLPNASVTISNPVSGFQSIVKTDSNGFF
jgi:hypothetical protein